jgi:hypothetical protein
MATKTQAKTRNQIDTLLNKADKALTGTAYFECETLCVEAIEKALRHRCYDQVAQAVMPLLECRRQRRVAAVEAGIVAIIEGELPHPPDIQTGVYLVQPPRVGVDGKRLRDAADKRHVPVLVLVREPTTQMGLVPVVAIAQRTIRTKMRPCKELTVDWILDAVEALGQAAIDCIDAEQSALQRTEYLWSCVQTLPDHEGVHKLLAETAEDAAQEADDPTPTGRRGGKAAVGQAEVDDLEAALDDVDEEILEGDEEDEDEEDDLL